MDGRSSYDKRFETARPGQLPRRTNVTPDKEIIITNHQPFMIESITIMKKTITRIFTAVLALTLVFSLAACGSKGNDSASGVTIAVPNDTTNEARALLLLEQLGYIKLKDGAGITATILDIVENPKGLNIVEVEAAQIPRSLPDVDMAVINGNYAIQAGLSVGKDAVATEDAESEAAQTYANILVVKEGNENDEGIQALVKALQSEAVKQFIIDTYDGAVVPMF
ncbi:MAG: methionine ABC transporter substrate-binding protein [Selenomonadaceae bacterium]|nr:methionine ABC transporter substrate-binding protein [Selenomonadaceae bacterium]